MKINFYLMHVNEKVADVEIEISINNVDILRFNIINEELCPIIIKYVPNKKAAFKEWWKNRLIPESRKEFYDIAKHFYRFLVTDKPMLIDSLYMLSFTNHCLSLTDKYWFNMKEPTAISYNTVSEGNMDSMVIDTVTFEDIDYFTNGFDTGINKFMFYPRVHQEGTFKYNTPSLTTNGTNQKFWEIIGGEFFLMKYLYNITELKDNEFNVNDFLKDEYPELALTLFTFKREFSYYNQFAPIEMTNQYVASKCFTTEETEFIPASEIVYAAQDSKTMDIDKLFVKGCKELGVEKDVIKLIEKGIRDVNKKFKIKEDRELSNYGLIRNINTGEYTAAPLFGNSYYKYIL